MILLTWEKDERSTEQRAIVTMEFGPLGPRIIVQDEASDRSLEIDLNEVVHNCLGTYQHGNDIVMSHVEGNRLARTVAFMRNLTGFLEISFATANIEPKPDPNQRQRAPIPGNFGKTTLSVVDPGEPA